MTLLSGQTVSVRDRNGTTVYRASSEQVRSVETKSGTYIFPDGVDLERFDQSLFNVDLLRQQNRTDSESTSVPLIVTTPQGTEDARLDSLEASLADTSGVTVRARLTSINAVAVAVNKNQTAPVYRWLAGSDLIGSVTLDRRYAVTLDEIRNETSVDAARAEHNVSGEGVVVAVVDSGIDQSHPDIDQVKAERDFTGDGTPAVTEDPYGHGTHIAGIVAGNGTASDGQYRWVAPNTTLLDVRVLDDQGRGSTSAIIRAINWSVDQGADVISLSLGGPARYERPNDPFRSAIQRAIDQNVTVVVSAGNGGSDSATITSPGTLAEPITVGATTKNGDVAYFSSRGPTPNSLAVKPTLVAPGTSVVSTASGQAGYDVEYVSMSGTSMSTPVVSGIAALLHDRSLGLTPQATKRRLAATADPIDGPAATPSVVWRGTEPGYHEVQFVIVDDDGPTTVVTKRVLVRPPTPPALVGNTTPADPDGNGRYEDLNGDGNVSSEDVALLFETFSSSSAQEYVFQHDHNGDEDLNVLDVQALHAQRNATDSGSTDESGTN